MNSKVVTIVLVVAILVSMLALQTEAFFAGTGGIKGKNGKRQLSNCAEVVSFALTSLFSGYLLRLI